MSQRRGPGELDDALASRITELCERGDAGVEEGRYDEALAFYDEALSLVPRPVLAWRVTAWIQTAIGETCYFKKDFERARVALMEALRVRGVEGNAFLHLRLGQVELELGDRTRALDELRRAFTRAGREIFEGEDPKYLVLAYEALGIEDDGDADPNRQVSWAIRPKPQPEGEPARAPSSPPISSSDEPVAEVAALDDEPKIEANAPAPPAMVLPGTVIENGGEG